MDGEVIVVVDDSDDDELVRAPKRRSTAHMSVEIVVPLAPQPVAHARTRGALVLGEVGVAEPAPRADSSLFVGAANERAGGIGPPRRKRTRIADSAPPPPIPLISNPLPLLQESWADAFAPHRVADVALFPQKIQSLREFLRAASQASAAANEHSRVAVRAAITSTASRVRDEDVDLNALLDAIDAGLPPPVQGPAAARAMLLAPLQPSVSSSAPRILVLFGPPGTGKSTAVRLVAAELGLAIRSPDVFSVDAAGGAFVPTDSLRDAQRALAFADGRTRPANADGDLPPAPNERRGARGDLDSFCSFISQSRRFKGLALADEGGASARTLAAPQHSRSEVLVVEDVPRTGPNRRSDAGGRDAESSFRDTVSNALLNFLAAPSAPPMIIIASEGEDVGEAMTLPGIARLLGTQVLSNPRTRVVEIDRCPETRMRKALKRVADASGATRTLGAAVLDAAIENTITTARGDVRHAIATLQFFCMRHSREKVLDVLGSAPDPVGQPVPRPLACGRDDFYDSLHTLGKLLHAKRKVSCDQCDADLGAGDAPSCALCSRSVFCSATCSRAHCVGVHSGDETPHSPLRIQSRTVSATRPLAFDPDVLVAASTYDAATTLAFLSENAPPQFSDVCELARALDVFSNVDVLLRDDWGSRGADGAASMGAELCAAAAARAIAVWNSKPGPKTFRPTRRPAAFALARVAALNRRWVTDEGLGITGDIVAAASHTVLYAGAAGCLETTERITVVIPSIGSMLRLARTSPPTPARTALLGHFSARAEALLVAAATSYGAAGSSDVRDDGEIFSCVGSAPKAARGNGTSALRDPKEVEGIFGGGDDDAAGSPDDGAGSVSEVPAPLQPQRHVGMAGLQRGMWELSAALQGVDVRCALPFARAATPSVGAEGALEDDVQECD